MDRVTERLVFPRGQGRTGDVGLAALAIALVVLAFQRQHSVPVVAVASTPAAVVSSGGTSSSDTAAPEGTIVAVFIGDAYAAGTGSNATRWTTVVSNKLGWKGVNLANGGTGYLTSTTGSGATAACGKDVCPAYDDVVPAAVKAFPDVVVVSGGRIEATT